MQLRGARRVLGTDWGFGLSLVRVKVFLWLQPGERIIQLVLIGNDISKYGKSNICFYELY